MAKRLAIEWDSREVRVVAGVKKGNRLTITDVVSAAIDSAEPQALGETLKQLLKKSGLERLPAGVALGRGKAELRELKLPPVPDEELAEMVRFEAMRSFATAGERSAIDFLKTRRDSDSVRVVAAAVSPDTLKQTALISVPAQVSVEHLILRPLAAAAFYRNAGQPCTGEVILVDLLADDADIVVLREGAPVFVRSVRLSEDTKSRVRTLSGEIRRSLMACQEGQNQDLPRRVVMWGRQDVHAEDAAGLSETLGTEVTTLDPFSLVDVAPALANQLPDHVGRLAPLVGMLHAELGGNADLIDFLNPRRAPEPASQRSTYLLAGAGLAAIVAIAGFFGWSKMRGLDSEIAALETRYQDLQSEVEQADQVIGKTAMFDAFLDGNVIWLDELRRTATKLPPADEAIVTDVVARVNREGGGSLTVSGAVTRSSTVAKMESLLRDENHTVVGKGTDSSSSKIDGYDWSFSETIILAPEFIRLQREMARQGLEMQTSETANEATAEPEDAEPDDANSEDLDAEDIAEPGDSQQTETDPTAADPTAAEPTAADPTAAEPTEPEPTEPEQIPPVSGDEIARAEQPAEAADSADVSDADQPVSIANATEQDTTDEGVGQ
ncbi:type IV pilus biogenesis protein PilM [Planctomycetaceae bacterium SH139]